MYKVTRTAEVLREHGFVEIKTIEVLIRKYEIREEKQQTDMLKDVNMKDYEPSSKRKRSEV